MMAKYSETFHIKGDVVNACTVVLTEPHMLI
jgi:hypothetical protein